MPVLVLIQGFQSREFLATDIAIESKTKIMSMTVCKMIKNALTNLITGAPQCEPGNAAGSRLKEIKFKSCGKTLFRKIFLLIVRKDMEHSEQGYFFTSSPLWRSR